MPSDNKKQRADERIKFMADRMAILMVEIIELDFDYGDLCFNDFYRGERADEMRRTKHYQVGMDFVRQMIRKHDVKMGKSRSTAP